jgi:signal transduction histidine kinase
MARRQSLARRLLIGAAIWSLVFLVLAAIALSTLYRAGVFQTLDDDLRGVTETLIAAVESNPEGEIVVYPAELPNDPRYARVFSGRYWAIGEREAGRLVQPHRSRSLWDSDLIWTWGSDEDPFASPGTTFFGNIIGPNDDPLRVSATVIVPAGRAAPVIVMAAVDRRLAEQSSQQFAVTTAISLLIFAMGLIIALFVLVRIGLAPLRRIEADISSIRSGMAAKVGGDYPVEVAPLATELNKLIEHNREVVDRARTQVGNLAHALKTPIAVMLNETEEKVISADVMRRQVGLMSENVQHYLRRAQAAANAEVLGARSDVEPVISDLARLMEKIHRDKTVSAKTATALPAFRGEKQDLEEMIGNLLDNACKWATNHVAITASPKEGGKLTIIVDDDGPGLTPEAREQAIKRGRRLDETAPGSGLGLSIVDDLSKLYGGALTLLDSPLGGLRAQLELPAA